MYTVKARYYSSPDQFGESFVLISDNGEKDLRYEVGTKVRVVVLCGCGKDADGNLEGTEYLCSSCLFKKISERWIMSDYNSNYSSIRCPYCNKSISENDREGSWVDDLEDEDFDFFQCQECDKFFEYSKASLGGYGKEEDERFEKKIINNILKETVIDKNIIDK